MRQALRSRWDSVTNLLGLGAGQARRLSAREEARFLRHLALMLNNGIPITEALSVLGQNPDPSAAWVADRIHASITQGHSLGRAFRTVANKLSPVCPAMVEAGERSGSLVQVLKISADWAELTADLKARTVAVLYYPAFVLLVNLGLAGLMLSYIFPVFLPLFDGESLPLLTQFFLILSKLAGSKLVWLLILAGGAEGIWYLSQPGQRDQLYRLGLWLPVVSAMLRNAARTRFCSVLSIASRAGLPLMQGLKLAAQASGDPDMWELDLVLQEEVRGGASPEEHFLLHRQVYGLPLSHGMALSQSTGKTDFVFQHMTKLFQAETEAHIEVFQSLVEPFLIGMVSMTTGLLLLAIYLPLGKFLQTLVA